LDFVLLLITIYFTFQVKRCHRDLKSEDIRVFLNEIIDTLQQLQVQEGMHHIAWKVLGGELKIRLDYILRKIKLFLQTCFEVSVYSTLQFTHCILK